MNTLAVSGQPLSAAEVPGSSNELSDDCAICYNALNPKRSVTKLEACHHTFDTACLSFWINRSSYSNETCPVCRTTLQDREIRALKDIYWMRPLLFSELKKGSAEGMRAAEALIAKGVALKPDEMSNALLSVLRSSQSGGKETAALLRSMGAELTSQELSELLKPEWFKNRTRLLEKVSPELTPSERALAMLVLIEHGGSAWQQHSEWFKASSLAPQQQDLNNTLLNVMKKGGADWEARIKQLEGLGARPTQQELSSALYSVIQKRDVHWPEAAKALQEKGATLNQEQLSNLTSFILKSENCDWLASSVRTLQTLGFSLPQQPLDNALIHVMSKGGRDWKNWKRRVKALDELGASPSQAQLSEALDWVIQRKNGRWLKIAKELVARGGVPGEAFSKLILSVIESESHVWLKQTMELKQISTDLPKKDVNEALLRVIENKPWDWKRRVKELKVLGAVATQAELDEMFSSVLENCRCPEYRIDTAKELFVMGAVPDPLQLERVFLNFIKYYGISFWAIKIFQSLGTVIPQQILNQALLICLQKEQKDWGARAKEYEEMGAVTTTAELNNALLTVLMREDKEWKQRAEALKRRGAAPKGEPLDSALSSIMGMKCLSWKERKDRVKVLMAMKAG